MSEGVIATSGPAAGGISPDGATAIFSFSGPDGDVSLSLPREQLRYLIDLSVKLIGETLVVAGETRDSPAVIPIANWCGCRLADGRFALGLEHEGGGVQYFSLPLGTDRRFLQGLSEGLGITTPSPPHRHN
jgi:hypothetical protein